MRTALKITIVSMVFLLTSCVEKVDNGESVRNQPEVSLRKQMLLSGPIHYINETLSYQNGTIKNYYYELDRTGNVLSAKIDGKEMPVYQRPQWPMFPGVKIVYPSLCFGDISTSYTSITVNNDDYLIEYEWPWDKDRFTRWRFIKDGNEMTILDGDMALPEMVGRSDVEEFLYEEHGWPRFIMGYDPEGIRVLYRYDYLELDKYGNPLIVNMNYQLGMLMSSVRTIEYYPDPYIDSL